MAPTPTGDLGEDVEVYRDFFGPTVADGARNILAVHNHQECREQKKEIEEEIKAYMLNEEGNPFREAAIPRERLDIAITELRFTEEMESAFSAPEIQRRIGEGRAVEEGLHLKGIMRAFKEEGIRAHVAALLAFLLRKRK